MEKDPFDFQQVHYTKQSLMELVKKKKIELKDQLKNPQSKEQKSFRALQKMVAVIREKITLPLDKKKP